MEGVIQLIGWFFNLLLSNPIPALIGLGIGAIWVFGDWAKKQEENQKEEERISRAVQDAIKKDRDSRKKSNSNCENQKEE